MIARLFQTGKPKLLAYTVVVLTVAVLLDWVSGEHVSLAPLYILPMMLGALALSRTEIAALAIFCAVLRAFFDVPAPPVEMGLRFIFASVAYFISGLFIHALIENHKLALAYMEEIRIEQERRREAEEQLRSLVESSPAAIFILNDLGAVLTANEAAARLLGFSDQNLILSRHLPDFIPFFANVLALNSELGSLRTAVKCQGSRADGEAFSADVWFSSYSSGDRKRLAAIVVDSSEEMRDREQQALLNIETGNRIAATAIAHEVRNFCQAIGMLSADLRQRHSLAHDESFQGLARLVQGLEKIASLELRAHREEHVDAIDLKEVLDTVRIIIEPEWREISGAIQWTIAPNLPAVMADSQGLLQAFLNLAQNSLRAVTSAATRLLRIRATERDGKVIVEFRDTGSGVQDPELLFQPFQGFSNGTGLGLYVSRFIVRSYGGELRFDCQQDETCFVVELEAA